MRLYAKTVRIGGWNFSWFYSAYIQIHVFSYWILRYYLLAARIAGWDNSILYLRVADVLWIYLRWIRHLRSWTLTQYYCNVLWRMFSAQSPRAQHNINTTRGKASGYHRARQLYRSETSDRSGCIVAWVSQRSRHAFAKPYIVEEGSVGYTRCC